MEAAPAALVAFHAAQHAGEDAAMLPADRDMFTLCTGPSDRRRWGI